MNRWLECAVCTALLLQSFACTRYTALTPPPPGRHGELNTRDQELHMSQGVALAFDCVTAWGNRCDARLARSADIEVARVYPAHLDQLQNFREGSFTPSTFVVVGVAPGETTLHVPDADPLRVVVIE